MIKFKYERDQALFCTLHPILIGIFVDLWWYAHQRHGVSLVVTQTVTNEFIDKSIGRVSSSHRECRAIDIRTKDLPSYVIGDLQEYINNKEEYKPYHYLSISGEKRLAFWHKGTAEHFHLAIHAKYKK
jgi:hypothetical protein